MTTTTTQATVRLMVKREPPRTRLGRSVVSISNDVYEQAKEISALTSQYGWDVLDIQRSDPPTLSAIFNEALKLLAARSKRKLKSR